MLAFSGQPGGALLVLSPVLLLREVCNQRNREGSLAQVTNLLAMRLREPLMLSL
jgi:hypothetical protein